MVSNKNFLKIFFKGSIKLQEEGWNKLLFRWVGFFIFLAILNEVVWRTQTEEIWINFKSLGYFTFNLFVYNVSDTID